MTSPTDFRPLPPRPDLVAEIHRIVRELDDNQVTTFGRVATALGEPGAAKFVASTLLADHEPARCQCHRVVRASGEVGLYAHGTPQDKQERLTRDGIAVVNGRVSPATLSDVASTDHFAVFREWQAGIAASNVSGGLDVRSSLHVVGVDASYATREDGRETAVAACVRFRPEASDGHRIRFGYETNPFPYVSGYLSVREVPAMVAATEQYVADYGRPDVLLVDGAGQLHKRSAGVAVCVGVLLGIPTIGVAKAHLFGTAGVAHGSITQMLVGGRVAGHRVAWQSERMKRPLVFEVSPGFGITPEQAVEIVSNALLRSRLPEPIALADRTSRVRARELTRAANEDSPATDLD